MSATKISFSLNVAEGLEALQQAAMGAGARSESLHAKQIVMAGLNASDPAQDLSQHLDDMFRETVALRRQVDALRQLVGDAAKQLSDQIATGQASTTHGEFVTRDDLRNALFLVLLRQRPSSKEEANQVADTAVPRRRPTSRP